MVNAWSRDGQEILLEMGFYFQVVPDTLAALFYEYTEDGYLPVIEDIATNTFRVSTPPPHPQLACHLPGTHNQQQQHD